MKKVYLVGLLVTLLFMGCKKWEEVTYQYKYEITGTSGEYSVTIQNTDNNTQQWSSVRNGWNYTWNQTLSADKKSGDPFDENQTRWLYLSAQNSQSQGNVTVSIYRNNKIVATNTGFGGFSIATVSGDY